MGQENSDQTNKSNGLYTVLECVFCKGTGIAKCFDFAKSIDLGNGVYELNELI